MAERTEAVERSVTITCPLCGARQLVEMPRDACQIRYRCPACGMVVKPLLGDCCVFCSYADHRCPPEQLARQAAQLHARPELGYVSFVAAWRATPPTPRRER
jgi:predicted RNA-binding Zn-ribbon protein involved in translation (DUF1610 family)